MTPPTPRQSAVGSVRVEILKPDTTSYSPKRYLSGDGAKGNHSKAIDGSGLSFTANALEAALSANPTMLEDAFARVEFDEGGTFVAKGTPYLLSPGSGTVRGDRQAAAREHVPVGVGALHGLASECIVLPTECDDTSPTLRHAGGLEQNRYLGWQSKGYSESLHPGYWNNADVFTPSSGTLLASAAAVTASDDHIAITGHGLADADRVRVHVVSGAGGIVDGVYGVNVVDANTISLEDPHTGNNVDVTSNGTVDVYSGLGPKYGEPVNWDVNALAAEYVYRNAAEGSLTLIRFGTFTLSERTTVKFIACCDEEGKLHLDGPNQGGVILTLSGDETGYTEKNHRRMRLEPGTYRVSAEMTTVGSVGGDGNDSFRFACGTIDDKGNIQTVLLKSDATARVHRQNKSDERPGMSPMETVRRLFQENADQGVTGASIVLGSKDFTDSADSASAAPAPADCREWVWPLGTPLSSCLADMSEDADFDLTPAFVFRCWLDRGTDKTTVTPTFLEYGWDADPIGPTRYLTLSQDGFDIVVGTSAESGTRARFGYFETGASASIGRAKRNAKSAIRQSGRVRRYYHAKVVALTGSTPYTDYDLCDTIHGLGYRDLGLNLEVTDIAWEQGSGAAVFTLELGEL